MKHSAGAAAAAASVWIPITGAAAAPQAEHIARIEARLEPVLLVRGRPSIAHTLAEEMQAHRVASVSVAVADHGRIIWAKAYGLADVAGNRPATTGTLYQAGSISKPVAASGALRLVQAGRLALDAPVNAQLTSWQIPANDFTKDHPVTLRDLLTHTGGLTVHGFPGYAAGTPVPTVVQVLEGQAPANTPPVVVEHQPGSSWNYSGGGLTIAQLMMTDVTHQPFPDLMREQVFTRLGMSDSTYEEPLPQNRAGDAATGYLRSGTPVEGRFHTYPEMAAAGLWTTPSDLAKWAIGLEDAYNGVSARLMTRASAKAMLTPGLGKWGLGVEVGGSGETLHFNHNGDDAGFNASLIGWPSGGRAIVVMTNSDDGLAIAAEITQAVAREYGWRGLEPRVIDAVALSPQQLNQVAGSYGHGLVVIATQGAQLRLVYGGVPVDLIPLGSDAFVADPAGANIPVKIGRGPDGAITSLAAQGLVIPRDP